MKKTVTIKLFWAAILLLLATLASATVSIADDSFLTPESKLTAAGEATAEDQFGFSLAVNGDTMVVGVPYRDEACPNTDPCQNSGAVYLFRYDGNAWVPDEIQPKITASYPAANDQFGWSVAIDGDQLAVGAPSRNEGKSLSGAVYLFRYDGNTWVPDEVLTASTPRSNERFGFSLALDGNKLVVGAPSVGSVSGSVYVYNREDNGEWGQEIIPLLPAARNLGWSVAIDKGVLVAGAPDTVAGGSAYVFDGNDWLPLPASQKTPFFGACIDISGDTVAVGAPSSMHPFTSAEGAGSVHLFKLQGSTWVEEDVLELSYAGGFGSSVSFNGNFLVVGAPFDDVRHPVSQEVVKAGSAYVFGNGSGDWIVQTKLIAGDPDNPNAEPFMNDRFGWAVATSDNTVVAGATFLDDAKLPDNAGAVYGFVLSSDNNAPTAHAEFHPDDVQEGDQVTLDGSLSNDPDDDPLTYLWVQKQIDHEPQVELDLSDPKTPTFLAPELNPECTTFTFDLTVQDDKGLASAPYTVEVPVQPNNIIHSTLGRKRKHRRWWRPSSLWHHYKFKGSKGESVTINMKPDASGSHSGNRATMILKDRIWGVRFWKMGGGRLPNTITATLPADGKYSVYVVKRPWFCRGNSFTGDYVLTAEGTCGKLMK
jgi:hypothetical protein